MRIILIVWMMKFLKMLILKVNTISLHEEISEDPIDVEQSDTKVNIPKCVIDPDTDKYYNCSNLN